MSPPDRRSSERVRYRFSPLERRGVIAGWRGGQIASVAGGLVVGVLAVRSRPSLEGVAVALAGLGVGLTLAFWPVRGLTGEQWLPLVVRWTWSGTWGGRRQHAPGPLSGHLATADPDRSSALGVDVRPARSSRHGPGHRSVFEGVKVERVPLAVDPGAPDVGVVLDSRARTATAVLAVRGHSFALLGPSDQDARIAGWARMLSSMAREGSAVHRVQWIETCLPDDGRAVRRYWTDHAVVDADGAVGRSYRALMDEAAPVTRRHQVVVGLTVDTARSGRSMRAAGGGLAGLGQILSREVHALRRALEGADVPVDGVLGPRALCRLIHDASAPLAPLGPPGPLESPTEDGGPDQRAADTRAGTVGRQQSRGAPRSRPGVASPLQPPSSWPWPMAIEPMWDAVHTDGTWHTTFWISEWPRVDVTPDFLGPLLFSPVRRSVSMVMEPVSPSRAARQVAQARTADLADGELRRRGGFLVTARHAREREGVESRDVELADGHAQYRFSGYVTVSSDTRSELTAACALIEQAAGQSGVELRLLYGAQDAAFACSLPLGRGLS